MEGGAGEEEEINAPEGNEINSDNQEETNEEEDEEARQEEEEEALYPYHQDIWDWDWVAEYQKCPIFATHQMSNSQKE